MFHRSVRTGLLFVVPVLAMTPASAGGARILGPQGNQNYSEIQAAVAAAVDGAIILVADGTYGPLTIDNKSVSIFAAPNAVVRVGTIEVKNLAAGRTVVLSGLDPTGTSPLHGLSIANNAGHVFVQDCEISGRAGPGTFWNGTGLVGDPGGAAVVVVDSSQVALVRSRLVGGTGYEDAFCEPCTGGRGGVGIQSTRSAVALYDCEILGGNGGFGVNRGGVGGVGCHLVDWGILASGSTIRGGRGGTGIECSFSVCSAFAGDGGTGLFAQGGGIHLVGTTRAGGAGGIAQGGGTNGVAGQATSGIGFIWTQSGAARSFSIPRTVVSDASTIVMTTKGAPGDRVHLARSDATDFRPVSAPTTGVLLLASPVALNAGALGTIPGSGTLNIPLTFSDVALPLSAIVRYHQGRVWPSSGGSRLGTPFHVLVLDRQALPDCNGNGINDYVDVIQTPASDCIRDLIPDSCGPAPTPDCNGNGVLDSCDISSGTSTDLNSNGVPDDCEPTTGVWYVHAAAAPGGTGTPQAPFRTIKQGIQAALAGHTVIVRDGVYLGVDNRNLTFSGRDLVIRSENGPGSCIIDCQAQAPAFSLLGGGQTSATRIEGFTIQNGNNNFAGGGIRLYGVAPVISNCVIRNCFGREYGGGIFIDAHNQPATVLIEGCRFESNSAGIFTSSFYGGGGIAITEGNVVIRNCDFVMNHGRHGGAVLVECNDTVTLAHCRILDNTADVNGGGIASRNWSAAPLALEGCLVVGNSANGDGGGLFAANAVSWTVSLLDLRSSTVAANEAARGGGLFIASDSRVDLANTVLWQNVAPLAAEIAMIASTPTSQLNVSYCDVRFGQPGVHVVNGMLNWGLGNISADPLFAGAEYRIAAGSPCIDAGDNAAVPLGLIVDLDGNPRVVDDPAIPDTGSGAAPLVDIGAYERQP